MTVVLETRRAPAISFAPETFDPETGTVEAVVSTGAPVQRNGYIEILAIGPEHVTFAPRPPVLDTHRQGSISDVKGRVARHWFDGDRVMAMLAISDPTARAAVERGDVTGISAGYDVQEWREGRDAAGRRTKTAVRWHIHEVSICPVPADANAHVRSNAMEELEVIETGQQEIISDPPTVVTRAQATASARAYSVTNPDQFVADVVTAGLSLQETRSLAQSQQRERSAITSTIRVGRSSEDPAEQIAAQGEALAASYMGTEPSERARPFMAMGTRMHDHMRVCLTRAGERNVNAMGVETLVTRSVGLGQNTTSDFPLILDTGGNHIVQAAYTENRTSLTRIGRQVNIPDFRDMTAHRIGGLPTLKKVPESGEIKHASIGEAAEKFKLDTYASIFSLSRQVLINDTFGVLGDFARNAGNAAANTERELLLEVLLANSNRGLTMSDGKAIFHADHGNLAGTGAAPSVETLSAARLAMRMQTGVDGTTLINVSPRYLLVSADLETKGEQILADLNATTINDQNPFSGKLTLLVEAGLPAGSWYLTADPAQVPTLAYGYLTSAPGPQLASRDGWDVLGREWRVVLDFGAGALDWRGAYLNPGEDDL